MTLTLNSAPTLASALIELRARTLKSVCEATDIRPANLSVWLKGKEQVISQSRVTMLLQYLGVVGGELDKHSIQDWLVSENPKSLSIVLDSLMTPQQKQDSIIFSDGKTDYPQTKFLAINSDFGWAWVRLTILAGLSAAPDLSANNLGFGQEQILSIDLALQPIDKPALMESILFGAVNESVERTNADDSLLMLNSPAMSELKATLEKAIGSGVAPEEITQVIASTFLT